VTGGGQEAARQLLTFAQTEFGEHLSALLLSGYGEGRRALVRLYDVVTREGGREVIKRFKLFTDDPAGLPSQDEPLVLLALLRPLWIGDQARTSDVTYTQERLLVVLGWPDTSQARASIGHAVERYYNLAMVKEEPVGVDVGEQPVNRLTSQRLVIGYDYAEEVEDGADGQQAEESRVIFNPDFLDGLRDRQMFGVSWDSVISIVSADR
jgi:hypothetical protein